MINNQQKLSVIEIENLDKLINKDFKSNQRTNLNFRSVLGADKQSQDNSSMMEMESHFMADDHSKNKE